jgi:WhiB family redox-sensing transcriptional regulator
VNATLDLPSAHRSRWQDEAVCAQTDPALFFKDRGPGKDAKALCATCPVQTTCLEEAMAEEGGLPKDRRHGVRGGLGPSERAAKYRQEAKR